MEGSGAARLLQIIKNSQTSGANVTLATVTQVSPLSIRIDGDALDTPEQALIVAENLTTHKRVISIKEGLVSGNVVGIRGSGTLANLTAVDAELTINSPLTVGSRVIVAISNDGQLIYVLDRAVI